NIVVRLAGEPGRTVLETGGIVRGAGQLPDRQIASHIGALAEPPNYYCELYQPPSRGLTLRLTYTVNGSNFGTLDEVDIGGELENGRFRLIFEHAPPNL